MMYENKLEVIVNNIMEGSGSRSIPDQWWHTDRQVKDPWLVRHGFGTEAGIVKKSNSLFVLKMFFLL